jgi:glyoxylase-like metal-dependent hydrolase (beta-lactamase superfamily II)
VKLDYTKRPFAEALGAGLYRIDTLYVRPGLAASHLLLSEGRAAFVDTGPAPALPRLLGALDELGVAAAQVELVILTHVHLDHAGGAGQLLAALPNARAVLHPRGAPHLVDPAKLIAGTIEVYGRAGYEQLYGELLPVPAGRVQAVADGERLMLGSRTLEFIDTPGHARHHCCIVDHADRRVFAGDTFGIAYREFDTAAGPFVFPTTTPVQFDPPALHASVERIMGYRPEQVVMTHFGPVGDPERLAVDLHAGIDALVAIARRHAAAPERTARMEAEMFDYLSARLAAHGYAGDLARRHTFLDDDVRLNVAGLEVWLNRGSA